MDNVRFEVEFRNRERNSFTIISHDDGGYTLRTTNGKGWKDWRGSAEEVPNIKSFIDRFEALANSMISQTSAN